MLDEPIDRRTFMVRAGTVGAVAASGGLGALLEACQSSTSTVSTSSGPPVRGGTLTVATVDTPVNLDPQDLQLYSSIQVYDNIFAKLVELDADFKFIPALASKWTQDDEKTWTLDLVENAFFHNGDPVTADDVRFTFQRIPDHALSGFMPAWPVEVLGPHRVRFHLPAPYGPFLMTLATFSNIVSQKAVTAANPKTKPVGSGPYRMVEWVQNDHVTLERWDKHFEAGKPYLDRVIMKAIGDDSVRLTGLQTGELGWIQRVPLQRVEELQKSNQVRPSAARPYLPDMINLNTTRPPFNDRRVRQALAWAIDRKEIAKLVYFDQAVAATEAVSSPNPLFSNVDPYKGAPDPDRAKSLLKQAGVSDLRIAFAGQPNVTTQVRTGEVLKSQLAKAGINMEIQNYAPAQWFDAWLGHNYDITTSYWSITNDPVYLYSPITGSKSPFNVTGLNSQRIDDALSKYYATIDPKARNSAYADLVRAVSEEAAVIFIDNELQQYWTRSNVFGATPLPHLDIRLADMWLKR